MTLVEIRPGVLVNPEHVVAVEPYDGYSVRGGSCVYLTGGREVTTKLDPVTVSRWLTGETHTMADRDDPG